MEKYCSRARTRPPTVIKSLVEDLNIEEIRVRRAGIILYTVHNGVVYFALGLDSVFHELTDFGGQVERSDRHALDTAMREFEEETLGIFEPLKVEMLQKCPVLYDKSNMIIFLHLEGVDPNEICQRFNKKYQERRDERLEVCSITWLSWTDFRACINDYHSPLFHRVRNFLQRAGNFTYLL